MGGTDDDFRLIIEDLLDFSGASSLDSLARAAKHALDRFDEKQTHDDPYYNKVELYRKISVYCDLEDDGRIRDKDEIDPKFSRTILEGAVFGVVFLRMVRQAEFSFERIDAFWPLDLKDEMEKAVQEMVKNVLAKRSPPVRAEANSKGDKSNEPN